MKSETITLVGMPASGKSTAGIILAKVLGKDFVDTDIVIQKRDGRRLPEIIAEDGIEGFLKLEEEVCLSLNPEDTVIATGGSVCYSRRAVEHFRSIGRVVYLSVGFEELARRLDNIQNRGVVCRPGQTLRDIYDERTPLYVQYADAIIRESDIGVENMVRALVDLLG